MPRIEVKKVSTISGLDLQDRPVTIGRSSENTLVLSDTRISRKHCIIESVNGATIVRDLGSQRGTFVNGERITESRLADGDRIKLGPFEIEYDDPQALRNDSPVVSRNGVDAFTIGATTGNGELTESLQHQEDVANALDQLHQERAQLEREQLQIEDDRAEVLQQKRTMENARVEWDDLHRSMDAELSRRAEQIAARAAEVDLAAAEMERREIAMNAQQDHQRQADAERMASLQQLLDTERQRRTDDNQRIGGLTQQLEASKQQIEQLTAAVQTTQQRLDQIDAAHRQRIDELRHELDAKRRDIEHLQMHKSTLQQQVEALESARSVLMERAAGTSQIMTVLRGQVQTLDGAAQKVAALQQRLADIEDAWVQADEELNEAESDDPLIVEAAMQQRQRMSAQLDALNRERDAAVATMRDSAERLLAISQHTNLAPPPPLPQVSLSSGRKSKSSIWNRLVHGAQK